MKKIIALVMCVLISVFALVSCEDVIGEYRPNYTWTPPVVEEMKFDMYIITDTDTDAVEDTVFITVEDKINQYISDKFKTTIDIHFINADDYAANIADVVSDTGSKSGIVLINSKAMMDDLMSKNALADLSTFLSSEEYDYGTLNVQIEANLLEAARETVVDSEGNETEALFCIPNNHVVGKYDYFAINKNIARDQLHYNETELAAIIDSDSIATFIADVESKGYNLSDVVKIYEGETAQPYSFAEKTELEAQGWMFNVTAYPEVTKEEVYSTAFGVLSNTPDYERAMEIIYALNTDATLRNMLQYGVENTNYKVVDGYAVPLDGSEYKMNIEYTGDVFKALYCDTQGFTAWTQTDAANGKLQNADSVVANRE